MTFHLYQTTQVSWYIWPFICTKQHKLVGTYDLSTVPNKTSYLVHMTFDLYQTKQVIWYLWPLTCTKQNQLFGTYDLSPVPNNTSYLVHMTLDLYQTTQVIWYIWPFTCTKVIWYIWPLTCTKQHKLFGTYDLSRVPKLFGTYDLQLQVHNDQVIVIQQYMQRSSQLAKINEIKEISQYSVDHFSQNIRDYPGIGIIVHCHSEGGGTNHSRTKVSQNMKFDN